MKTCINKKSILHPLDPSFKTKIFTVLELCRNGAARDGDLYEKVRIYHPDVNDELVDEIFYWYG